ncbi:hypothetical protein [Streptomyces griseorubiginosus]
MTWQDALMAAPGWAACALIPLDWWLDRRFKRQHKERWGVPYKPRSTR